MKIIWSHEKVRNVAKKCKHRSEFQEKWSGAYKYAKKNHLIDELFPELFPNHNAPDFWNYDECKKVSKKYRTLTELKSVYIGAYKAMLRYGWLDEFYPDRKKHKPNFDYSSLTYEKCKKIASKYKSPSKLMLGERPIYNFSLKNEWLLDFYPKYTKQRSKWTYDECHELVLKYEYLTDFIKECLEPYNAIRRNKWHDLLGKLNRKVKPLGYWTYEKCKEEALKHTKRQDLDNSPRHYIYKNGWYNLFEHMDKLPTLGSRYIYAFEFDDNHVYIGLTYKPEKRKCDHLCVGSKSRVRRHIDRTNSGYEFKILTNAIDMKYSSREERYYIDKYKNDGWVVLNGNKGGSLGGGKRKYTYEQCKNKVSEYKTLNDFTKQSSGYYNRIMREKWFELLEPLQRYKNYVGTFDYYKDRYPKAVKLLKKGIPNKDVIKITGYSPCLVSKVKSIIKKNGI